VPIVNRTIFGTAISKERTPVKPFLAFTLLFAAQTLYAAAMPPFHSIEACAVGLTPQIQIVTLSDREQYAWLNLITEETYDSAKTAIKASGDVDLLDLIKIGNAEADYSQFSENRRKYLEKHQGTYSKDLSLSIYTEHLTADAHTTWLECVKSVSRQPGLWAWFEQEQDDAARLVLHYYGTPGTQINAKVTALGTSSKLDAAYTLLHDGEFGIILKRQEDSNILVNVTGGQLTAGAASAYPGASNGAGSLYVSPYVVTPQTAGKCADHDNCSFCINAVQIKVDAPTTDSHEASLALTAGQGGAVSPAGGPFKFSSGRQLDDIKLTSPAKLKIQLGNASAVLAIISAGDAPTCSKPTLQFPQSTVTVNYPEPRYEWVTSGPFTAQVVAASFSCPYRVTLVPASSDDRQIHPLS